MKRIMVNVSLCLVLAVKTTVAQGAPVTSENRRRVREPVEDRIRFMTTQGEARMTIRLEGNGVLATWAMSKDPSEVVQAYYAKAGTMLRMEVDYGRYGLLISEMGGNGDPEALPLLDSVDRDSLMRSPLCLAVLEHGTATRIERADQLTQLLEREQERGAAAKAILAQTLSDLAFGNILGELGPRATMRVVRPMIACHFRSVNRAGCMDCCEDQDAEMNAVWCPAISMAVGVGVASTGVGTVFSGIAGLVVNAACSSGSRSAMKSCKKECVEHFPQSVASR